MRVPRRPQRPPEGPQKAPQESLMQLPRKPRLGSREPRDCPSEFYAVGAVCVKFLYGPKIPKKAPKDPRGTPEGAPRRPDAAPKTVPRRVKIASRWPAGILRGGRRARKIHRMPQRSQEGSEGASREPPQTNPSGLDAAPKTVSRRPRAIWSGIVAN